METKIYEAFWHKNFEQNGHIEGDIIDSVGERSYSKSGIIKLSKKEFKKLYTDKKEYEKMCKEYNALSIDISIECFLVEYDGDKLINPEYLYRAKGYDEQWDSYFTSIDKNNYRKRI